MRWGKLSWIWKWLTWRRMGRREWERISERSRRGRLQDAPRRQPKPQHREPRNKEHSYSQLLTEEPSGAVPVGRVRGRVLGVWRRVRVVRHAGSYAGCTCNTEPQFTSSSPGTTMGNSNVSLFFWNLSRIDKVWFYVSFLYGPSGYIWPDSAAFFLHMYQGRPWLTTVVT